MSLFPIGTNGQWHGGIHRGDGAPVRAELPGELVAYRISGGLAYPSSLPKRVSGADRDKLPPRLREGGFHNKGLNCWIPPNRIKQKNEELFRALGLCMSSDFMLLRHTLHAGGGRGKDREIVFYSLYMHFRPLDAAPPCGTFHALRGIEDLPFGEEPPFYIRYRFLAHAKEETVVRGETRDTKEAVFLPMNLAVSSGLREFLDAQEKQADGAVLHMNEYVLPPTFTGHPSIVCLVPCGAIGPPLTDEGTPYNLQNIFIQPAPDTGLYVKRPGGIPVSAGVFGKGGNAICDILPHRILKHAGMRYLHAEEIQAAKLSPELEAAAGYIPLENLSVKPGFGKPARVLRNGALFVLCKEKLPDSAARIFFSREDELAAQKHAFEFCEPDSCNIAVPVMYVRAGDCVERARGGDERVITRWRKGSVPVSVPCIKVWFSLRGAGLYIREDQLPFMAVYHKIHTSLPLVNARLSMRRRGLPVYQDRGCTTLVDFIDTEGKYDTGFLISDKKPFSTARNTLEIIRCDASGSPGTRGYIKKEQISRFFVEWKFAELLSAGGPCGSLQQSAGIQYPEAKKRPFVKAGDILGLPGRAEIEDTLVHIEVFMKNTETPFDKPAAFPLFQKIPAGTQLYELKFADPTSTLFKAGTELETEKPETDSAGRELYPRSRKMRIKNNPANSCWLWYDAPVLTVCGSSDKDTILLNKDTRVETYSQPPEVVMQAEELSERTNADLFIPKEDLIKLRCFFDEAGTAYWAGYPDYVTDKKKPQKYIRLAENFSLEPGNWKKFFTRLDSGATGAYTESQDRAAFLKQALNNAGLSPHWKEPAPDIRGFLASNEKLVTSCAFEHPSEWSARRAEEIPPPYKEQYAQLCEKLAVWDSSGRNGSLPEDIQNGEDLLYVHPETFIPLARLSMGPAFRVELLKFVQDMAMNTRALKKGGTGINAVGDASIYNPKTTFCNMGTYCILRATDKNYKNFTGIEGMPWERTHLFQDESCFLYLPKQTNVWHDIMLERSKDSARTGLVELTPEQAQDYANLGYTVIGAWKNLEPGKPPHYVTVRPGYSYDEKNGPVVANIGEFVGISWMSKVHGSQFTNYRWFYNFRQGFIKNNEELYNIYGFKKIQEIKERRK